MFSKVNGKDFKMFEHCFDTSSICFILGLKPYAGMNATELITELKRGYRLEKPRGCSDEM